MNAPKKRLGRGLDALLGSPVTTGFEKGNAPAASGTTEMAVSALRPGRHQPRLSMAKEKLAELAKSIREQGVLQPLVVRPAARDREATETHEIVAGERRWRAAQLAGLGTVPVVVRDLDDQSALAVALIENLQREDLSPIEQAESLSRLVEDFSLTHQQAADAVGRSRSSLSNLLRLLELNGAVKNLLAAGKLEMGHARALLSLPEPDQQSFAARAVRGGWSVRRVEAAVRRHLEGGGEVAAKWQTDTQTQWLQEQLSRALPGKVMLKCRRDGSYKLDIAFSTLRELRDALGTVDELMAAVDETAGPRVTDN